MRRRRVRRRCARFAAAHVLRFGIPPHVLRLGIAPHVLRLGIAPHVLRLAHVLKLGIT